MSEPLKQDEPVQVQLELEDDQLDNAVSGATRRQTDILDGTSNTILVGEVVK